jgi:hypothetical protein
MKGKKTETWKEKQTDRQEDIETDRHMERKTYIKIGRQRGVDTSKEKHAQEDGNTS